MLCMYTVYIVYKANLDSYTFAYILPPLHAHTRTYSVPSPRGTRYANYIYDCPDMHPPSPQPLESTKNVALKNPRRREGTTLPIKDCLQSGTHGPLRWHLRDSQGSRRLAGCRFFQHRLRNPFICRANPLSRVRNQSSKPRNWGGD